MSSLVTKKELFSTDRTVTSSSPGETPVSQLTSLTCEHPLFIFACANFSYLHACVYTHTHAHIHHTRGHTRTRINTFPRPNIFLVFSIFRPLQQSSQKKEFQGASRGRISPCQRPPLPALPPVYTCYAVARDVFTYVYAVFIYVYDVFIYVYADVYTCMLT